MKILGLSAYYHDSAAALLCHGEIVYAAQEERFSRRKHDAEFPGRALRAGLGSLRLSELDAVVFYEKPFLHFDRLLETHLAFAPRGLSSFCRDMQEWLSRKLFMKQLLLKELRALDPDFAAERLLFCEHHLSHAASAFFASPFARAAVLTVDGTGEWTTTAAAVGSGNSIRRIKEIRFPHSLGMLYSAVTAYAGFKVNSGECKLMGLAPYGSPRFVQTILDHLLDLRPDGSFRLNLKYFDFCSGLRMFNSGFEQLFGHAARVPESEITQHTMDLAASIQSVLEEALLRLTRHLARETGEENLCLAGGVSLNCVANGKIRRDGAFRRIWVQPAAGDAGGALGTALAAQHMHFNQTRYEPHCDDMKGAFLGPEYPAEESRRALVGAGARFESLAAKDLIERTAQALSEGRAVGWHQGRSEFGPRALGNRSILADPRRADARDILNRKIKFRESFRPFAPAVPSERQGEWFEMAEESPYMLFAGAVKKGGIPAVTHVDNSARLQTVSAETNPLFHALLMRFEELTGCPVLVNTSFNVRGEPLVETPLDAFRCFMGTGLDVLVVGPHFLEKTAQPTNSATDYHQRIAPD